MSFKFSSIDSQGNARLFPYYWDGTQIVEGDAPSWTNNIYYFGESSVRRDYGAITPWLTVVFAGASYWIPWYVPGPETEMPSPPPPPPITTDPCINISDFGIELRNETFTFSAEAINFITKPEVDRIASLEKYTANALVESKNLNGRFHKFICTNFYIDNLVCWVKHVSYDMVPEYDLFIAKYYFPNGIPTTLNGKLYYDTKFRSSDGYYYVTTGGRICYIEEVRVSDPPPIVLPPKPDVIGPETPLIGAGSVYSSDLEGIQDIEFETRSVWDDNAEWLPDAYCHCDGTNGSTLNTTELSFGFDVYNYPFNYASQGCIKKLYRVAYGNFTGAGYYDPTDTYSGTKNLVKAVYSQYAQKILGDPFAKFKINNVDVDEIFVIEFPSERYKTQLDPGNWELHLGTATADTINPASFVPANITIANYTDDILTDTNLGLVNQSEIENSYDIKRDGSTIIGKLYPHHGVMIFNNVVRSWTNALNAWKFYKAIGNVARTGEITEGFRCRRRHYKYTNNYFLRVKNQRFNLSNNPTYIDEDFNVVSFMRGNPKVYVTSVGLYNAKKELLAVGKLPKPFLKDFNEETVINVKISQ